MPKNKFFYYSEEDCAYVEVSRSYFSLIGKSLLVLILSVTITVGFMKFFGSQFIIDTKEREMQMEITRLTEKLSRMNAVVEKLSVSDDALRTAVNLPVVSKEIKEMGVGGKRNENVSVSVALISVSEELIEKLSRQVELQQSSYEQVIKKYEENKLIFASIPAIRPNNGERSSGFGMRFHPIYQIYKFHTGQDYVSPVGTDVFATGNATVESAQFESGYGNVLVLDHGFGYKTLYAHLSKFKVKIGQKIKRGEVIALSGNTGITDGPHVHYEVFKDGVKMNPSSYLFDDMTPNYFNKSLAETEKTNSPLN